MTEAFADLQSDDTDVGEQIQDAVVKQIGHGDSTRGRLIPFSYYGGKYQHLHWLLPLLPERKAYVEPFGGSGVVLLNRDQSDVETFNDTFGEVTNFFKVLRDQPEELFRQITLTPYSEEDFETATDRDVVDPVEQARRFFVVVNQSYNSAIESPTWSYNKGYSARGISKKVSNFQAKLRRLGPIADRLTDVQITNREATDVIETFDTDDGLIYCDPPYPKESRQSGDAYVFEMDEEDHRELANTLHSCDADVAVSSYDSDLYHELFTERGWRRIDAEEKELAASPNETTSRTESLYVNYDVTDEMMSEAFE